MMFHSLLLSHVAHLITVLSYHFICLIFRNVGDAILTIKCEKKSLKLNLTELFDTQLPHDKLLSLSETLPSLTTLYTRASFLPTELRPFPLLAALIVDFDFDLHKQVFFPFLKNNGRHLRKLTLIDQVEHTHFSLLLVSFIFNFMST